MSRLFSNLEVASGLYDRAQDPNSGAVGLINLGVHIPKFSRIISFLITTLTTPLSAGLAAISFGLLESGVLVPTNSPSSLMGLQSFSYYTSTGNGYSLSGANGFVVLTGTVLTLTAPVFFATGDIGENTLVGAPTFGTGSNRGPSPQAVNNATTLYNQLKVKTGTNIPTPATLETNNFGFGAGVLVPGVYTTSAAIGITAGGVITFNGAGDYIIISTGGAFTSGNPTTMVLTNGATADRIYWVINSAITTGANNIIKGNFMTPGNIVIGSTNALEGRLLSQAATTIDGTASSFNLPTSGAGVNCIVGIVKSPTIDSIPLYIPCSFDVTMTIATAALTAGKFQFDLTYVRGDL